MYTVESLTGSLLGGTLKEHSVPPGRHCPQVPLTQQLGMKCPRLWKWESWVSRKDSTCDPAREASSDNFREKEEVNSASDRIRSFVGWLVDCSRPQKSLVENTNLEMSCTVGNCKVCPGKSPARAPPPHEVPCTVCSSIVCSGKSPARAPTPPQPPVGCVHLGATEPRLRESVAQHRELRSYLRVCASTAATLLLGLRAFPCAGLTNRCHRFCSTIVYNFYSRNIIPEPGWHAFGDTSL